MSKYLIYVSFYDDGFLYTLAKSKGYVLVMKKYEVLYVIDTIEKTIAPDGYRDYIRDIMGTYYSDVPGHWADSNRIRTISRSYRIDGSSDITTKERMIFILPEDNGVIFEMLPTAKKERMVIKDLVIII